MCHLSTIEDFVFAQQALPVALKRLQLITLHSNISVTVPLSLERVHILRCISEAH